MSATVGRINEAIADGVRHARFARLAGHGIVAAFAIGETDRMNRRKINDVEAHGLRVVDAREAVAKGRTAIAVTFGGAGKEFIPGRVTRRDTIDRDLRRRHILRGGGAIGIGRHQDFELAGMRDVVDAFVLARADLLRDFAEPLTVLGVPGTARRGIDQGCAFQCFTR